MSFTSKDLGYTIYSRLEESLRLWIREKLLNIYGANWIKNIPKGILDDAQDNAINVFGENIDDPMLILEEINIPDLMEIVLYHKSFSDYIPLNLMTKEDFKNKINRLYEIRIKIAHVKSSFSIFDLDLLIKISESFLPILKENGAEIKSVLNKIKSKPEEIVFKIPSDFLVFDEGSSSLYINNLPVGDYAPDGGFIGRKKDLSLITKLLLGDLHRVITISGAGGVGKTALAHRVCQNIINMSELIFDAIIWVSAKEEKLTVTGIEPIEPSLRNYGSILDNILETYGWVEDLEKSIEEKEDSVRIILQAGDKGILLVIDNLETIQDERVFEFIKDFPPPSKVMITSRVGLGEVERRYQLKEMTTKDAIILLRTIAREKGACKLAELGDDVLSEYVERMSKYPLAHCCPKVNRINSAVC